MREEARQRARGEPLQHGRNEFGKLSRSLPDIAGQRAHSRLFIPPPPPPPPRYPTLPSLSPSNNQPTPANWVIVPPPAMRRQLSCRNKQTRAFFGFVPFVCARGGVEVGAALKAENVVVCLRAGASSRALTSTCSPPTYLPSFRQQQVEETYLALQVQDEYR